MFFSVGKTIVNHPWLGMVNIYQLIIYGDFPGRWCVYGIVLPTLNGRSYEPRGRDVMILEVHRVIHAIRAATHIHLASERGKTMEKPWKNHTFWMIHQCFPTKIAIFGVCTIFRDIHLNLVEDLEKDLALRRWRSIQPDMISEVSAQPFATKEKRL